MNLKIRYGAIQLNLNVTPRFLATLKVAENLESCEYINICNAMGCTQQSIISIVYRNFILNRSKLPKDIRYPKALFRLCYLQYDYCEVDDFLIGEGVYTNSKYYFMLRELLLNNEEPTCYDERRYIENLLPKHDFNLLKELYFKYEYSEIS